MSDVRRLVPLPATAEGSPPTDRASRLPQDLVAAQLIRIELFYLIGVGLWAVTSLMDFEVAPNGDRGPYQWLIGTTAAALAAATAGFTRFSPARPETKIATGVAAIVPHAFALALLNSWVEQPTSMRPLSPITVLILFFGMMAPGRPRSMLAAAGAAASMDPLGVWIAHLRGLPVPPAASTFLLFYPNYVCALLAVAPARILYAVGTKLRAARAFGSYQLVERLGQGGMGEVWLARHALLARSAAIKLVRQDALGGTPDKAAATLRRFRREAQATAALSSPHTIRVYDFGLTDCGTFYYAMELLDGLDLDSFVRRFGPLPPWRAMYLLAQACRSLAEAHAKGLVHRDIKPANLYVCRMGLECDFVKVLDFGLVRIDAGRDETSVTMAAVPMGTPGYMAPEVILGAATPGPGADVYALGCVAHYLLTGQPVFAAPSAMTVLLHHLQDEPVAPSQRAEQRIPGEIDALVLACLRKDPARRPRDAGAVLRMIADTGACRSWDAAGATEWWSRHLPDPAVGPGERPALGWSTPRAAG